MWLVHRSPWSLRIGGVAMLLVILYAGMSYFLASSVANADRTNPFSTPEQYGLSYTNVEFPTRGSAISLSGWHIHGSEAAPTIIFVHGFESNRAGSEAVALAADLRETGFNSLLFDLRGHGSSGGGQVSGGYFEQYDLLGAYDYLVEQGVASDTIGVIGFSMGAATAALAVSEEPSIRALVLDSPFADISDLISQEVARKTPLPEWLVPLFTPGTKLAARVVYGIKLGDIAPVKAVTRIDYPIVLVHGQDDTRIPSDHGARVHAASHVDSELWLVPDSGHVDAFLNYPKQYVRLVEDYFLERLTKE